MSKIIKKTIVFLLSFVFIITSFSLTACDGTSSNNVSVSSNKTEPVFSTGKKFLTYCDRPPTPTPVHLQRYKEAGFTHYLMTEDDYKFTDSNGAITKEYREGLQNCEDLGLDVLIRNYYADSEYFINDNDEMRVYDTVVGKITYTIPKRNITTELTDLDVVKGYYMADEPSYYEIDNLVGIVDWYNKYGGKTLFHINLNSSYGQVLFPENTWEEYLDKYINVILKKVEGPKTLSIDYYPMRETNVGDKYIYEDYLYNLITVADKAKQFNANITDGNEKVITSFCIEAYKEPDVREISSTAEISFQINMSIAFGAKNLEYYMYRGMTSSAAMVEAQSQLPRALYYYVKEANEELAKIADIILSFDYNGAKAYTGSQVSEEKNAEAISKISKLEMKEFSLIKKVNCRLDTVITEMVDKNNNKGYMIVNYSEPTFNMVDSVKLTLNNAKKAFVFVDGESKIVELNNSILNLSIGAGKSAFVYPICG